VSTLILTGKPAVSPHRSPISYPVCPANWLDAARAGEPRQADKQRTVISKLWMNRIEITIKQVNK